VTSPIPSAVLVETDRWGRFFAEEWRPDFPDSTDRPLAWRDELAGWLAGSPEIADSGRTARVMKRLRRVSPRAYEVALRAMVYGESLEQITAWLNERAARNNIPVPRGKEAHYTLKDTTSIFAFAVDWARYHW
jgi:hypothetical protein